VGAFTFGRSFPGYRFRPLDTGFDSYCLLGTLLIGSGAILFVTGAILHFCPPTRGITEAGATAGEARIAGLLIASLIVGVCLAFGLGGNGASSEGGKPMTPEEAARLHTEMLQQQEALKRLQPQGPGGGFGR